MKTKIIKANTQLPRGAVLLRRPLKKKIGGWVEMQFDAKVKRFGLEWYRVRGGFSDNGDREDWVCNLPKIAVSVSDYQWREPRWGLVSYPSFNVAIMGQIQSTMEHALKTVGELAQRLEETKKSLPYAQSRR